MNPLVSWSPVCKAHAGAMRQAFTYLDAIFHKWGYQPRAGVTGSFNCRKMTGSTSWSRHAFLDGELFVFWTGVRVTMALAVDVNWDRNPYGPRLLTDMPRGMVEEVLALRTNNGVRVFRWGGNYSGNKDAMHYEIDCTPQDLATGIQGNLVVLPPTLPTPPQPGPARCLEAHPTIKIGARGAAVNHLQFFLIRSGAKIEGDGDFGPATDQAVRNHQVWLRDVRKEPIGTVDGVVGPKTWQAIHNWADGLRI